jgi:hypothetical protein
VRPIDVAPDLVPLDAEEYDAVVERYAAHCARIPGVHSIHQFGSVGAPGLSDLDVIVVLDDDALASERLQELSVAHPRWRDDATLARCFIHDVLVCSVSQFEQLHWAIVSAPPRLVSGEPVAPAPPDEALAPTLRAVQAMDFAVARIHELERLRERPRVSLRWLVPQLWSLVHTKRVLVDVGAAQAELWAETERRLRELRATPVAEIRPERAGKLYVDVRRHYLEAIDLLAGCLVRSGALPALAPRRRCVVADPRMRTVHAYPADGSSGAPSVAIIEGEVRIGRRAVRAHWTRADLPSPLLAHLVAHLRRSRDYGPLAARIASRAGIAHDGVGSDSYRTIVARRMALTESNAELHARLGLEFGRVVIPGVPAPIPHPQRAPGSWRFELLRATLDWRLLPVGTIHLDPDAALR